MISLLRRSLTIGALAAACLCLSSCLLSKDASGSGEVHDLPDLAKRTNPLPGTTAFWPSAFGDNADSLYCPARLKLPLAEEPVWTYTYSEARFSGNFPDSLLHREGMLYVSAQSSQILALKAADGQQGFNLDLYEHLPAGVLRNNNEEFESIQLHPRNLLYARDNLGRHYCWDLEGGTPRRLWLGPETSILGQSMLAREDALVAAWNGSIRGMDELSGRRNWRYPTLNEGSARSDSALIASDAGRIVSLPMYQGASVVDSEGRLLWKMDASDYVSGACIDNVRERVYLFLDEAERLECRSLVDGGLVWQFDYSYLLPPQERLEIIARTEELKPGFELFSLVRPQASQAVVFPDGIAFSTMSGEIVFINVDGSLRWERDEDCMTFCWGGYENALMLRQLYLNPEDTTRFLDYVPFSLDEPQWAARQPKKELEVRTPFANANRRYLVLDPQTGAELDSWDFKELHRTPAVPAGDKIAFGYDPGEEGLTGGVVAYNWLEAEDSN